MPIPKDTAAAWDFSETFVKHQNGAPSVHNALAAIWSRIQKPITEGLAIRPQKTHDFDMRSPRKTADLRFASVACTCLYLCVLASQTGVADRQSTAASTRRRVRMTAARQANSRKDLDIVILECTKTILTWYHDTTTAMRTLLCLWWISSSSGLMSFYQGLNIGLLSY